MYYHRDLINQTGIDYTFVANVIQENEENIVVVKGNILEVYAVLTGSDSKEHLIKTQFSEFYSRILGVTSLKRANDSDILISCICYDPTTDTLKTVQIFDFESKYIDKNYEAQFLSTCCAFVSNIHKSIAALLLFDKIILFFCGENSSGDNIGDASTKLESKHLDLTKSNIKFGRIIDIVFLNTYGSEILGVLYENLVTDINLLSSRSDTVVFSALVIDKELNDVIIVWSKAGLPFDSYKIVPVCGKIGGVAVFGDRHLVYASQASNFYLLRFKCSPSNLLTNIPANKTIDNNFTFTNSVFISVDEASILGSVDNGALYMFEFMTVNQKVIDIDIKPANFTHHTSSMCCYKDLVFIASRTEKSFLIDFSFNFDTRAWTPITIDKIFNAGCLVSSCFGLTDQKNSLEIATVRPVLNAGYVHIIRRSIKFTVINTFKIPTVVKVGTVTTYHGNEVYTYLVITLKNSTIILLCESDMVEIDRSNFITEEPTLEVFETHYCEIIQVTHKRIRLFKIDAVLDEVRESSDVLAASYCYENLCVLYSGNVLIIYRVNGGKLLKAASYDGVLCFSCIKLNNDIVKYECIVGVVFMDGIFCIIQPSDMAVIFRANIFHIPNYLKTVDDCYSSDDHINLFVVKEIFFAYLGRSVVKMFLIIRTANFIVLYESFVENKNLYFKRCKKIVVVSDEGMPCDSITYLCSFKKNPAVFIKSNPPKIIMSHNTETVDVFSIDSQFNYRSLIRFHNNFIHNAFVALDNQYNIDFLQLNRSETYYDGWVHKIFPVYFMPLFIDFHPNFNTYFISGQTKIGESFPDSAVYSFSPDNESEIKQVSVLENQEISNMKLLMLNYMDSRALFLALSSNTNLDDNIIGKLTIYEVISESTFSLIALHVLEFEAGILGFDCLDGKIVISSFDQIYMVEFDKESNSFLNIGSIQVGYSIASLKCLKNFVVVGDMLTGVNLLHFQKSLNYISLLSKRDVKKIPLSVDFVINGTKTDIVASYSDCTLITYSYNPEVSKTKNGTELTITAGMKLPTTVVSILKLLDKHFSPDSKITVLFLIRSCGAMGLLIPLTEKIFRRHILLKSRLNNYLPDDAALNFSRERGMFCYGHFVDSNTKQILDEILLRRFLSLDLMTCYKILESYGISLFQILDDIHLFDQYIIKNFRVK